MWDVEEVINKTQSIYINFFINVVMYDRISFGKEIMNSSEQ